MLSAFLEHLCSSAYLKEKCDRKKALQGFLHNPCINTWINLLLLG